MQQSKKEQKNHEEKCVFCSTYRGCCLGSERPNGSPEKLSRGGRAESAEVKIDNFSFGPATLTVSAGTTVTWTNRDDIPHTVTSSDDPKVFKSKVLDTDEKFSFTFTKSGTYPYFCSIHPKMTAKVIVQ